MLVQKIKNMLRFYFITDDNAPGFSPVDQARVALNAGATILQYRNKWFTAQHFEEVVSIRDLCKQYGVPFIINDNILLAKAVCADGVHLGQDDDFPKLARKILGDSAIIGTSVSTPEELKKTDLACCDYIGTGPVFPTSTKTDAKPVIGLSGLASIVKKAGVPVVAIGGIVCDNATSCLEKGAAGVATISFITRAENPAQNAKEFAMICECPHRERPVSQWSDEFQLITKLLKKGSYTPASGTHVKVPPGDDACLLKPIRHPVVTTDTQKEGVHFRLDWQTPEEIGIKAVSVTLSDLAASYARPLCLFVNLSLPDYVSDSMVESLYTGINKGLAQYDCELGGGNISRGGELSLDLFAVGDGRDELFPVRSGAVPGDGLYSTGPLGLSAAGLESLIRKDMFFTELIKRFKFPRARFEAAEVLAENNVRCAIDVSDGLAGDARHIAEASGITIEFHFKPETVDPDLVSFCKKYNRLPQNMVFEGGEDYEILFTCTHDRFDMIKQHLPTAFQVGRCLKFNGKHLSGIPADVMSFRHREDVSQSI